MTQNVTDSGLVVPEGDDAAVSRHPGSVRIGLGLTYLAAATIPWTAVGVGSISMGEVFLALGGMVLLLADLGRPLTKLPTWVWFFAFTVIVVGFTNEVMPTSLDYLNNRASLTGTVAAVTSATVAHVNLSVTIHLAFRIAFIPFVFCMARGYDHRALARSATAFVIGTAICSLVAFSDSRGFSHIGSSVTGINVSDSRAAGFTDHPNTVAYICVLGLPLAVWLARQTHDRARIWAVVALLVLLLGLYASRSRSGALAAVVGGIVAIGWLPQYRRHLPTIGIGLGLASALAFFAIPGIGNGLLSAFRLSGSDTSGSDASRNIVNDQAKRDFLHSPIRGIGLEIADEAHIIYLQALAVGGLILLVGLVVYQLGALIRAGRLAQLDPLAIPLFASVLGGIVFNTEQNALTPTIAYLTTGMVAALPIAALTRASDP